MLRGSDNFVYLRSSSQYQRFGNECKCTLNYKRTQRQFIFKHKVIKFKKYILFCSKNNILLIKLL